MPVREILQLGHPLLYRRCEPVRADEADAQRPVVEDLHDTLFDFRARWSAGRAIAAPQIGVLRRVVYMHVGEPVAMLNPVLDQLSEERFELWDDCMSFPELLVRVARHQRCRLRYRDLEWNPREMMLEGDMAELLQHECDHLDGILAVGRAVGPRAFALRSQRQHLAG